jgi:hypothetical protein
MRSRLLAGNRGRAGIDRDEAEDARCRSGVDPRVHPAALDDDAARLQMRDLAAVEFEIAFARQQQAQPTVLVPWMNFSAPLTSRAMLPPLPRKDRGAADPSPQPADIDRHGWPRSRGVPGPCRSRRAVRYSGRRACGVANLPKDQPLHLGFGIRSIVKDVDLVALVCRQTPWYSPGMSRTIETVVAIDENPLNADQSGPPAASARLNDRQGFCRASPRSSYRVRPL